jgi:histone deacetylase complex subunit SAP18
LRELSDLVKDVLPAARGRMARLSFAFVYPDRKGRNVMRQVGTVFGGRPSQDDRRTLRGLNFQIGDFLDVAVLV